MTSPTAAARFERFAIPEPVMEVVRGLQGAGHQAFLVGGCVRDVMRGAPPKDFDLATSARPEEVQRVFKRVIPTGIEHGTVTVVVRGQHVEVTTFRAESEYLDGRRPSKVDFHTDIEADLSRRDFTINAMAWDPQALRLIDPFNGTGDLDARVVRCVRSAVERFLEDGLRAMRAIRFASVLGFTVEPETEAAIPQALHVFRKVAMERINQEFSKTLVCERAASGLELARRTGLLGEFLPEAMSAEFSAVDRAPPDVTVRLAVLLQASSDAREVVLRLKYPTKVAADVGHLVRHRELPDARATDAELRRWLARVKPEFADAIFDVTHALGREPPALRARVTSIRSTNPPLTSKALALNGADIMAVLGVGPSPVIGQATQFLLERVLDEPSVNSREALSSLLRAWQSPS